MQPGITRTITLLVVLAGGFGPTISSAQVGPAPQPDGDAQLTALSALRRASRTPVEVRFANGFPRDVLAGVPADGADAASRALAYLRTYRDLYRWTDAHFGLGVRRVVENRRLDLTAVVLYQTYDGIPVHGGELVVHVRGAEVVGTIGTLLHDVTLDSWPTTDPRAAEDAARRALDASSTPRLTATELVVFDPSLVREEASAPRLAWQVLLGAERRVFVDAHTLDVLDATTLRRDAFDLDIKSAENESASASTACYFFSIDSWVADEHIISPSFGGDSDAFELWNAAPATYAFYKQTFNRHGYDGSDGHHEMWIHASFSDANGNPVSNAGYNSGCDLWDFSDGMTKQDIVTHEYTHGVIDYTSELDTDAPPGALNESYADVMAALQTNDWSIGETSPAGIRDCSKPPAMLDQWSERTLAKPDNFGVHANANFMNFAAFLLADGGTHPGTNVVVQGISRPRMRWLYYNTMTTLPSSADYVDARTGTLLLAQSAGFSAKEICSIRNAFGAVQVGLPDLNCDGQPDALGDVDLDGIPDNVDNCMQVGNPGQKDTDGDKAGDACDADDDQDGVPDAVDDCPLDADPGQEDVNFNHIGDACDPDLWKDSDGDGVVDFQDNCPDVPNPKQLDWDADGYGDACDPDTDSDGWSDDQDNCPTVSNLAQLDADGDGLGDACDKCPNDPDSGLKQKVIYPPDGPAKVFPPEVPDTDSDGIPDACDPSNDAGGLIQLDGFRFSTTYGAQPDAKPHTVEVSGTPGTTLSMPVALCVGPCSEAPRGAGALRIDLAGLDDQVVVVLRDDRGHAITHARGAGARGRTRLQFEPRGGRRYTLTFALGPRFAGRSEFRLVESGRRASKVTPPRVPPS